MCIVSTGESSCLELMVPADEGTPALCSTYSATDKALNLQAIIPRELAVREISIVSSDELDLTNSRSL